MRKVWKQALGWIAREVIGTLNPKISGSDRIENLCLLHSVCHQQARSKTYCGEQIA